MNSIYPQQEISIIIEWENAVLAQDQISHNMLRALKRECAEVNEVTEVRFVFDPLVVAEKELSEIVERHFSRPAQSGNRPQIIYQPLPGLHYYEMKNEGAKASKKDIVVFLDSDVAPDEHWLQNLTMPLLVDREAIVSSGASFGIPEGLVGAAFAAGWFFPLPSDIKDEIYTTRFFANNVAFNRDKFIAKSFPTLPEGVTRGACLKLARSITESGGKIHFQSTAKVWHPAPNGLKHIIARGMAQGRDKLYIANATTFSKKCDQFIKAIGRIFTRGYFVHRRIRANAETLGEGGKMPIRAALLMSGYYALSALGMGITIVAPRFAKHAWKI